jgi:hypothetical protein
MEQFKKLKKYSTAHLFLEPDKGVDIINNQALVLSYDELVQSSENLVTNPFNYYINDYGYRGRWELLPYTKKIGFFGCSCTFGAGVDEQHTFAKIIESYYNTTEKKVESFNFGMNGGGVHRMAKLFSEVNNMIEFDTIVVSLPSPYRFLTLDKNNNYADIVPNASFIHAEKEKLVYSALSINELKSIFADYVRWIWAEAKAKNINVVWGSYSQDAIDSISEFIDDVIFWHFGPPEYYNIIPYIDYGRDNGHPGIKAHAKYAEEILKVMKI